MTITRREALFLCAAPALAQVRPKVAITMDDVWWQKIPENRRAESEERLLNSLVKTRAFLFAIGQAVDNEPGARILDLWSSAGHRIGNHTYTHTPLSGATKPEDFEAGILRTDPIVRKHAGFRQWFRFPALKEGDTRQTRDRLRAFLALHGYRNGAVTIDTSDWYYNQRLLERIQAEAKFDVARYRQPYLQHIWDRAQYYDSLAREVLGHSVSHTILIHYNLLNALFLADLLAMFRSKGWGIVDAEEAFSDPVFKRQPDTAPAGESLIWALAKETGKFDSRLRYPGEDDTYEKASLDRLGL
jgi:peptidoglycan/xylan/chitin deacetylase (PgdA/CDA1 family)